MKKYALNAAKRKALMFFTSTVQPTMAGTRGAKLAARKAMLAL